MVIIFNLLNFNAFLGYFFIVFDMSVSIVATFRELIVLQYPLLVLNSLSLLSDLPSYATTLPLILPSGILSP